MSAASTAPSASSRSRGWLMISSAIAASAATPITIGSSHLSVSSECNDRDLGRDAGRDRERAQGSGACMPRFAIWAAPAPTSAALNGARKET